MVFFLNGVTGSYKALQGVTWGNGGLERGYMGLKEVTESYMALEGATWDNGGLKGVTWG